MKKALCAVFIGLGVVTGAAAGAGSAIAAPSATTVAMAGPCYDPYVCFIETAAEAITQGNKHRTTRDDQLSGLPKDVLEPPVTNLPAEADSGLSVEGNGNVPTVIPGTVAIDTSGDSDATPIDCDAGYWLVTPEGC
ncbi:hypothetical protein [Actinoplanes sp. DH11]|uniref:hypothetical protein n=1 Tax=Actinoplanes sp. DH11 TaxID=2857011 RepID=UPI001E529BE6|nr:hypothetical protein [Actinoplanes sp. DH11]